MGRDTRRIDLRRIWDPVAAPHPPAESDVSLMQIMKQPLPAELSRVGVDMSVEYERVAEDEPPPCVRGELLDAYVEAFLTVMPRRLAKRFLRVTTEILESRAGNADVLPIRPPKKHSELRAVRKAALAMHKRRMPLLTARLARE